MRSCEWLTVKNHEFIWRAVNSNFLIIHPCSLYRILLLIYLINHFSILFKYVCNLKIWFVRTPKIYANRTKWNSLKSVNVEVGIKINYDMIACIVIRQINDKIKELASSIANYIFTETASHQIAIIYKKKLLLTIRNKTSLCFSFDATASFGDCNKQLKSLIVSPYDFILLKNTIFLRFV